MPSDLTRRTVGLALIAAAVSPTLAVAQTAKIWSSDSAYNALRQDRVRMIDVRSRPEWADTGIAEGAWPISMHEDRFPERLFFSPCNGQRPACRPHLCNWWSVRKCDAESPASWV